MKMEKTFFLKWSQKKTKEENALMKNMKIWKIGKKKKTVAKIIENTRKWKRDLC